MSPKFLPLSRRQFLFMGGGTALTALLGGAYLASGCPLSDSGVCVGPCAAYIDLDRDGFCDRIRNRSAVAEQRSSTQDANSTCVSCPFGIVNDPYPGQCHRYVDENNNGICDLSETAGCVGEAAKDATLQATPQATPQPDDQTPQDENEQTGACIACPFGIVNDPYPGQCRRYVDENNNGICDLSETAGCADEAAEYANLQATPQVTPQVTPQPDGQTPQYENEQTDPCTACPLGRVNDPYPGECRRYVDRNGNGLCDLSEPGSCTGEAVEFLLDGTEQSEKGRGEGGQRRHGNQGDGT